MALTVEEWPINRLIPYAKNPRKNDHAIEQMAQAITEFGFRIPIVAMSDGSVVDGHLRLKAGLHLGLKTVPVALADGLSPAQIRAFRLLANRSATWADWDLDFLRDELFALQSEGFDLTLTGFDVPELADLFATKVGQTDPDDLPPVPENPVSRLGDVWLLGNHRLVCGDSTDAESVSKALGGAKPHLMVTDPPYGVSYDPKWRTNALHKDRSATVGGEAVGVVLNDDRADWADAWKLFLGDVAYVWHDGLQCAIVATSLNMLNFQIRAQIIWAKSSMAIGRGHYQYQHEPLFYAVREGATGHWVGDRKQSTLWEIPKPSRSETGHSTQKPVECMKRPMENNSLPGDAVYEPFSGSGTTIIAGEMIGRHIHAIELSPAYVDLALRRWEQFTGRKGTLEATSEVIEDVAASRTTDQPPESAPVKEQVLAV